MMRFLLDTHVWLWLQNDTDRVRLAVVEQLSDPGNQVYVSAATSWELAIKHKLGKLKLPQPPEQFMAESMAKSGVLGLGIEHAHALLAGRLPSHHRDPFDRVLIAQAKLEEMTLVSADGAFAEYELAIIRP